MTGERREPDPELQETAEELEQTDETGEEEFFGYPEDYIFAVFNSDEEASTAVERLAELGLSDDDVATFSGDTGAESIDSSGEEHGVAARLLRVVQMGSSNVDHMIDYERAAADGNVVVGVHAPDEAQRQEIARILLDYDTRAVNFFGKFVVETLRP